MTPPEPSFNPADRWFRGPPFLWKSENSRPKEWTKEVEETYAEIEEIRGVAVQRTIEEVVPVERFSSLNGMVRTMVYFHRAITTWKRILWNVERSSESQRDELVKAEESLCDKRVFVCDPIKTVEFPNVVQDVCRSGWTQCYTDCKVESDALPMFRMQWNILWCYQEITA